MRGLSQWRHAPVHAEDEGRAQYIIAEGIAKTPILVGAAVLTGVDKSVAAGAATPLCR